MKYQEYQPHASLWDHVKCFWIIEKEYAADRESTRDGIYSINVASLRTGQLSSARYVGAQHRT